MRNTPFTYGELHEIVATDAVLQWQYINIKGETCVVGQIALRAGYTPDELRTWGSVAIEGAGFRVLTALMPPGVSLEALQMENDVWHGVVARRLGLHALLDNAEHPRTHTAAQQEEANDDKQ